MKKNMFTNTDQEKLGMVIFIASRLNSRKRNTARNRGVFYDKGVKSSRYKVATLMYSYL